MKRDTQLYLLALKRYERTMMTDGEYIKDDVLYCANCNTPKAMPDLIDQNGNLVMCACECRDRRNREDASGNCCRKLHNLKKYRLWTKDIPK